ncbi:MAG: hypothetical protein HY816_07610 [Candidatus Wallbacteria bacterium]|nr:hypothetical protein [Candidatus Wallbacteria bacterium]
MWRTGTVYEPARLALSGSHGLRAQAQSLAMQAKALERAAKKTKSRPSRIRPVPGEEVSTQT